MLGRCWGETRYVGYGGRIDDGKEVAGGRGKIESPRDILFVG